MVILETIGSILSFLYAWGSWAADNATFVITLMIFVALGAFLLRSILGIVKTIAIAIIVLTLVMLAYRFIVPEERTVEPAAQFDFNRSL